MQFAAERLDWVGLGSLGEFYLSQERAPSPIQVAQKYLRRNARGTAEMRTPHNNLNHPGRSSFKLDWIGLGTWGVFTSPMGKL